MKRVGIQRLQPGDGKSVVCIYSIRETSNSYSSTEGCAVALLIKSGFKVIF
jgi:hypothetical protein